MPVIHLETFIVAPASRCFDLMRDVDAHTATTADSRERAVAGRTTGLLQRGDEVTWEATHFGVRQRLTAKVTRCEPPTLFEDVQVGGPFTRFTHLHQFRDAQGGTIMVDDFEYETPLGIFGWLANRLFLDRYMRAFLRRRALGLRDLAERGALDER
jgi:ligand-binding SRPBCC domain-containing protein